LSTCSNITSSKRPPLVTLSSVITCLPRSLSVSSPPLEGQVPEGRDLVLFTIPSPNPEQCLARHVRSVHICGRKEGGREEGRIAIKENTCDFRNLNEGTSVTPNPHSF
jgi:hypothetical protein